MANSNEDKRPSTVWEFMRTAFTAYVHTGTLFPSSSYAARVIMSKLPAKTDVIVEYGAGNGVLTRELLASIGPTGQLHAVEIVDEYIKALREIEDERLTVLHENVRNVALRLPKLAKGGVDAIISGIPFSFLSPTSRKELIELTCDGLRPGGRFIVYQNSPVLRSLLKRTFGNVSLRIEPRNIPPYFIMVATKS